MDFTTDYLPVLASLKVPDLVVEKVSLKLWLRYIQGDPYNVCGIYTVLKDGFIWNLG